MEQGGQAFNRRAVDKARFDGIETRSVKASDQFGVGRHGAIVALSPLSKELQNTPEALSIVLQTLENWLLDAGRAAGLDHGQMCAHIGNGKGGAYDPSQWNAARKTGNLPLGRMLAGLPDVFWRTFAINLATAFGLHVSHADIADVAIERTAVAFEAAAEAFRHMQRKSA